jgi:beta-lactamase class A
MADNNYSTNNGPSPFRRYEPPSNHDLGNVAPLSDSPAVGNPSDHSPRIIPRRSRSNRSRWRQWVNSTAAPNDAARKRASHAASRPSTPSPSSSSARRPLQSPLDAIQAARPPALSHEPSQFVKESVNHRRPASQARRERGAPHVSAYPEQPQPAGPSQPSQPGSNKVTPIRQRPVWSSPAENPRTASAQRRDRKPRRSTRKTPQPVLYGIRLLILGTGVAAIVGTVLSSFNPSQNAPQTATAGDGQSPSSALTGNTRNVSPAVTQPLPLAQELVSVETDLVALESMTPGLDQTVFFYDLATGNYIDLNGTAKVPAASTIKVPLLIAFLQAVDNGTVSLDQAITLREDMIASGSGDMQFDEPGTQYTALEVATEMIVSSDNTATNLIIDLLGGLESLNQQFRGWGLEATQLRNLLPDLDGTNTTSAADLVRVMVLVDQGELLNLRSRDRLFSIMQRTYNKDLIPDGLIDETALTYNKTGDIGTVLGDLALVDVANGNRYVLGVLVQRPFNDGRASELVRRVAGRIHEEMNQPINPLGAGLPEDGTAPSETDQPLEASEDLENIAPEAPSIEEDVPNSTLDPESGPIVGPDGIPPG